MAILLLPFLLCSYRDVKSADTTLEEIGQSQPQSGRSAQAIYASDPDHIWNRLFRLFYVRHARDGQQYGGDELDPYLWWQTKYLLSSSSHDEALKLLDEFLGQHSERAVTDPLRRAFFQCDLLAIYDWLSLPRDEQTEGRSDLQKRVTEIIRRLALSKDQVRKLPDNYEDAVRSHVFPTTYDPADPQHPFLPADLFDPKGSWICLGEQGLACGPPSGVHQLGAVRGEPKAVGGKCGLGGWRAKWSRESRSCFALRITALRSLWEETASALQWQRRACPTLRLSRGSRRSWFERVLDGGQPAAGSSRG
jgi:hypothetical protein